MIQYCSRVYSLMSPGIAVLSAVYCYHEIQNFLQFKTTAQTLNLSSQDSFELRLQKQIDQLSKECSLGIAHLRQTPSKTALESGQCFSLSVEAACDTDIYRLLESLYRTLKGQVLFETITVRKTNQFPKATLEKMQSGPIPMLVQGEIQFCCSQQPS